jgi:hypothetical protein
MISGGADTASFLSTPSSLRERMSSPYQLAVPIVWRSHPALHALHFPPVDSAFMTGDLSDGHRTTSVACERGGEGPSSNLHTTHTTQYMYDTRTIRSSSAVAEWGAVRCGQEEVRTAASVSRRGTRLEERKNMVVDGERKQQHAHGLGDRQEWGRQRTATDTERAERASIAQSFGGPKWPSSRRMQCLSESISETQQQLIRASSRSRSTNQQRVRS